MTFLTLINHKYKFVYFWNAKCACTTMKKWFLQTINIDVNGDVHDFLRNSEYTVSKESLEGEYKNYFKFIVVRNPWNRLVSYYCNKNINGIDLGNSPLNCSFNEFVNHIVKYEDKYMEHHIQPQTYGLDNIDFDYVVKMENLEKDMKIVCSILEIPINIFSFHNKTKINNNVKNKVFNWRPSQFKKYGIPPYKNFYNKALIGKVRTKYIEDIVKYNYVF